LSPNGGSRDLRTGDEILQDEFAQNPFFPFQLGLTVEERSRVFTLKRPYREKLRAQAVAVASTILIILLLVTNTFESSLFVYSVLMLAQSFAIAISFQNERIYVLDEGSKTYSFIVGDRIATGKYHNIYIRLSKETLTRKYDRPKYHLVLDGVKVDRQRLTTRPSTDLKSLRRLGQKLAKNIKINFFDEANISIHHKIRHYPENAL